MGVLVFGTAGLSGLSLVFPALGTFCVPKWLCFRYLCAAVLGVALQQASFAAADFGQLPALGLWDLR